MLLHGVLDVRRGIDVLQLDTVDLDAPLVRSLVENRSQLAVDRVSGRERLVQVHFADDVAQCGLCELLDRVGQVDDLVDSSPGIRDLEVDQGVDLGHHVVPCDDVLSRKVVDRLAQVDARHGPGGADRPPVDTFDDVAPVDRSGSFEERPDDVDTRWKSPMILAQALDDHGLGLGYDLEAKCGQCHDEHHARCDHVDHSTIPRWT